MTTIELTLLLGLVGGVIGVASFLSGRRAAAKKDGHEWGALKSDIAHIKEDLGEIKLAVGESARSAMAAVEKEREERREAVQRVWDKLDEHVKSYHNIG